MMLKVWYDSKNETFKKPFGAVKSGEVVRFSLHVAGSAEDVRAFFIYRKDTDSASIYMPMTRVEEQAGLLVFSIEASFETPDLYFYRFEVFVGDTPFFIGMEKGAAAVGDWLGEWQLTVYDADFKTPAWAHGGILYQIFPDRFRKGDGFSPLPAKNERKMHTDWYDVPEFIYDTPDYRANDYFGGNILGIIEKIPYLRALGVTALYVNPVFESPEYHRYSTGDYKNIDPYFGTNEQFLSLCKACREAGIRVILDGVFSHTGADSVYFNKYGHYESEGAANSVDSPYYNWYSFIQYPEKYESWWGFENLPNVRETHPDYMEFITGEDGVLAFWQKKGAGGWRLDVADELPDAFLDSLYARVKKEDPEALVIGEVWEDATNKFAYGVRRRYLLGRQMDSVMNYPWRTAILEFIKGGDAALFESRLLSILENYPEPALHTLMNSLSTHDTVRAITYFGVEHDVPDTEKGHYRMTEAEYEKGRARLMRASFLQFTLPGIPCIYYGDEVGLYGFRDPYCRMAYPWGREDTTLFTFFQTLAAVREKYREDFSAPFRPYAREDGLYAFLRGRLLCAINEGKDAAPLPFAGRECVFAHGKVEFSEEGAVLFPNSAVILK